MFEAILKAYAVQIGIDATDSMALHEEDQAVQSGKDLEHRLIGGLTKALEEAPAKRMKPEELEKRRSDLRKKIELVQRQLALTLTRQELSVAKREATQLLTIVEDPEQRAGLEKALAAIAEQSKAVELAAVHENLKRVTDARDAFAATAHTSADRERGTRVQLVNQQLNVLLLQDTMLSPRADSKEQVKLMHATLSSARKLVLPSSSIGPEGSLGKAKIELDMELLGAEGELDRASNAKDGMQPDQASRLAELIHRLAGRAQRLAQLEQTARLKEQELQLQNDAVDRAVDLALTADLGPKATPFEKALHGQVTEKPSKAALDLSDGIAKLKALRKKFGSIAELREHALGQPDLKASWEMLAKMKRNDVVQGYFLQVKGEPAPQAQKKRPPSIEELLEKERERRPLGMTQAEEILFREKMIRQREAQSRDKEKSQPEKPKPQAERPPDEVSDKLVLLPSDEADTEFFAKTQTAGGEYNDPANLGKYVYQVTQLANILRKAGGIAKQGLLPGQGGKPGGSVGITGQEAQYFGVSLQDASEVNSRQKVATSTNRKDGSRIYVQQREKHVEGLMKKSADARQGGDREASDAHAAEAAKAAAAMLRFPIRAEYIGKFNKDPVHLDKNLELLDGTHVPAEDIEVLVHGAWISIVDRAFQAAYAEAIPGSAG